LVFGTALKANIQSLVIAKMSLPAAAENYDEPPIADIALTTATHNESTDGVTEDKESRLTIETIADRSDRSIAQLLSRFKNLVDLVPESRPETQTTAAVQVYQMEVESAALVHISPTLYPIHPCTSVQFRLKMQCGSLLCKHFC
jgi:hypothetical protein